jgi:hypothetical protein
VNIDKDLQTVQDISDVNIIILIYLFIKHVLFILICICTSAKCMSVELKVYLFIWSYSFRFSMSLSLSPNSLYRQTTDCTEGGGLTREHCILLFVLIDGKAIGILTLCLVMDYIIVIVMVALHLCIGSTGKTGKYFVFCFQSTIRWAYIYGVCDKLMHWYIIYI